MLQHHTKIQNGGRIVVPVAFRQAMNLVEGEEVVLRLDDDGLHVHSVRQALARAQKIVAKYAGKRSLVDELLAERRKEAADD